LFGGDIGAGPALIPAVRLAPPNGK